MNESDNIDKAADSPSEGEVENNSSSELLPEHNPDLVRRFFSFRLDKVKDHGEDADPVLICESDHIVLVAFDGLGGAGSQKMNIQGEEKSSAYFSSRLISSKTKTFFTNLLGQGSNEEVELEYLLSDSLKDTFQNAFDLFKSQNSIPVSRIKSSIIRSLPSTIAGIYILQGDNNHSECYTFSAGDSRVYSLHPNLGLQQLTSDDLDQEGDAFDNLTNDSKMSNFISPDLDFKINTKHYRFQDSRIFFACTDGCFDYVSTPMEFEYLLISEMSNSATLEEWSKGIQDKLHVLPVSDDCSMALAFHGWQNYDSLKQSFSERLKYLQERYIQPFEKDRKEISLLRNKLADEDEGIIQLEADKKMLNDTLLENKEIFDQELSERYIQIDNKIKELEQEKEKIAEEIEQRKSEATDSANVELGKLEDEIKGINEGKLEIKAEIDRWKEKIRSDARILWSEYSQNYYPSEEQTDEQENLPSR